MEIKTTDEIIYLNVKEDCSLPHHRGDKMWIAFDDLIKRVGWLKEQLTIEKYKKSAHVNWMVYTDIKIDQAFPDLQNVTK